MLVEVGMPAGAERVGLVACIERAAAAAAAAGWGGVGAAAGSGGGGGGAADAINIHALLMAWIVHERRWMCAHGMICCNPPLWLHSRY